MLLLALALASMACGEDGQPRSGYSDPCASPVAPVLSCPSSRLPPISAAFTPADACSKLTSCGTLAGEFLERTGEACSGDDQCGTGECLRTSDGEPRCHQHRLDYLWCVRRLTTGQSDPCDHERAFTAAELESALACIAQTPCEALGLPFGQKRIAFDTRPHMDRYTCAGGRTVFTSTVCDHGLLYYDRRDP